MKSKQDEAVEAAVGTATVVTETQRGEPKVEFKPVAQALASTGSATVTVQEAPAAPDGLTQVVVIRTKGLSALVEWQDDAGAHRSYVPVRTIRYRDESPYVKDPSQGIAYGVDFTEAIRGRVSPKEIHAALNRAGIWTWEDVLANPTTVVAVVVDATGVANHLLASAREETNNG